MCDQCAALRKVRLPLARKCGSFAVTMLVSPSNRGHNSGEPHWKTKNGLPPGFPASLLPENWREADFRVPMLPLYYWRMHCASLTFARIGSRRGEVFPWWCCIVPAPLDLPATEEKMTVATFAAPYRWH